MRGRKRVVVFAALGLAALGVAFGPAAALTGRGPAARHAAAAHVPAAVDASPAEARVAKGLALLEATPALPSDTIAAVATFGAPPVAAQLDALRALGLQVQGFDHLPLAAVVGVKDLVTTIVGKGLARDVYPNEALRYFSEESTAAMHADVARAEGVTGKGVGIAIVDSGVDATHPVLADHVTHNVKVVGPEYLNLVGVPATADTPPGTIIVPIDQGPYSNSDLASGHGTHVAGIAAGDGTGDPELIGVAPDADIIGYSTGDAAFVLTIVAAFDHILENHDAWNIDVVNNSWGSGFRLFDPDEPINVASKALADAGIVVTFSAGNDTEDGSINPYSVAPWVISVGAGTVSAQRSSFTSGGFQYDNALAASLPDDGHLRFTGDRIGIYHPDVSAPGSDIVSAGTPTGAYVGPTAPGGKIAASGTSMSSPHVAGLAALILEARPSLTPEQVRLVMETTAVPMADGTPFWRAGHGWVDAKAAVDAARSLSPVRLRVREASETRRVQGVRDFRVLSSDLWMFDALPVTVGGADSRSFELAVGPDTQAVSASVAFPTTPLIGVNFFEYSLELVDAAGTTVATTEVSSSAGVSQLFVDLATLEAPPAYGTWTVEVAGLVGASDPNILLGNKISVHVAQLARRANVTPDGSTFTPTGSQALYFTPSSDPGPLPGLDGCDTDADAPLGALSATPGTGACREGFVGYAVNYGAGIPASFEAATPSDADVTIGGPATLVVYLSDAAQPLWSAGFASGVTYSLEQVDAAGETTVLATGETEDVAAVGPTPTRGEYSFDVPPVTVPAGSKLRLTLAFSGVYTSTMRLLYGGGDFADAGIVLTTGVAG